MTIHVDYIFNKKLSPEWSCECLGCIKECCIFILFIYLFIIIIIIIIIIILQFILVALNNVKSKTLHFLQAEQYGKIL